MSVDSDAAAPKAVVRRLIEEVLNGSSVSHLAAEPLQ